MKVFLKEPEEMAGKTVVAVDLFGDCAAIHFTDGSAALVVSDDIFFRLRGTDELNEGALRALRMISGD